MTIMTNISHFVRLIHFIAALNYHIYYNWFFGLGGLTFCENNLFQIGNGIDIAMHCGMYTNVIMCTYEKCSTM